jgi:hypothetical protein
MQKSAVCDHRLPWFTCKTFAVRDPGPNEPDVIPIREPEPEPDTPDPEPGDEPERIDPVRTAGNSVSSCQRHGPGDEVLVTWSDWC